METLRKYIIDDWFEDVFDENVLFIAILWTCLSVYGFGIMLDPGFEIPGELVSSGLFMVLYSFTSKYNTSDERTMDSLRSSSFVTFIIMAVLYVWSTL